MHLQMLAGESLLIYTIWYCSYQGIHHFTRAACLKETSHKDPYDVIRRSTLHRNPLDDEKDNSGYGLISHNEIVPDE